MDTLKKENWWIWLLLLLFTRGGSVLILGALIDNYHNNTWYTKWYYWLFGILTCLPFFIMLFIFYIQMLSLTASKAGVSGSDLYLNPYVWIILLTIPVLGWALFVVLYIYLHIDILVCLKNGSLESYIK